MILSIFERKIFWKRLICLSLAVSMLVMVTGCHYSNPDVLSQEDFLTETVENVNLYDEYYKLSEKYRQLYLNLEFDISIPTDMKVYDSGEETGIVILSDSAGKNFMTLETKPRSDYQIVYNEYLNTVTSGVVDRDSIKTYDDFTITVYRNQTPTGLKTKVLQFLQQPVSSKETSMELKAKRFDVKVREVLQKDDDANSWYTVGKKCISYWFLNFDGVERNHKTLVPKTCFIIMTETFVPEGSTDFSNVDIMQKSVNTINLTRFLGNA